LILPEIVEIRVPRESAEPPITILTGKVRVSQRKFVSSRKPNDLQEVVIFCEKEMTVVFLKVFLTERLVRAVWLTLN